jgi:transmembrane sensor
VSPPPLDASAREAIAWMVRLQSGEAGEADQAAFSAWLAKDERHRLAWQHLSAPVSQALAPVRSVGQKMSGQGRRVARAVDEAASRIQRRRRALRGALALGGLGVGTAALVQRWVPLQEQFADMHTATGERRRYGLPDGSSLLLNARSAADLAFDARQRGLRLRRGAAVADIVPERHRPFSLQLLHGEVRSVATADTARVLVQQREQDSLVVALQEAVDLAPLAGPGLRLAPGEAASLSRDGARVHPEDAAAADAWARGRVVAYDRPLGEVVEALRPYRVGLIRISEQAAALRVYGNYPLDDTLQALASIAETLPVLVHVHSGGWLVRIELA